MTDLWGDINSDPIKTPVSILREQGALLEKKTNGVLTVKVTTNPNIFGDQSYRQRILDNPFADVTTNPNIFGDQSFDYGFIISGPSLNYQYQLFSISHDINIYPVKFQVGSEIIDTNETIVNDEDEFLKILEKILKSPKTQHIVNALLSQSVTA